MDLQSRIRTIPDFPRKGISFKDITTVLKDPEAFTYCIEELHRRYRGIAIDKIVAIESRGFITGAALAHSMHKGFVPIRKPGKLPAATLRKEYSLEYGNDAIEIHKDAIVPGERILIHDDVLATGGTMNAACSLVKELGGTIVGLSFLIELAFLKPRAKLSEYDIVSLVSYQTE